MTRVIKVLENHRLNEKKRYDDLNAFITKIGTLLPNIDEDSNCTSKMTNILMNLVSYLTFLERKILDFIGSQENADFFILKNSKNMVLDIIHELSTRKMRRQTSKRNYSIQRTISPSSYQEDSSRDTTNNSITTLSTRKSTNNDSPLKGSIFYEFACSENSKALNSTPKTSFLGLFGKKYESNSSKSWTSTQDDRNSLSPFFCSQIMSTDTNYYNYNDGYYFNSIKNDPDNFSLERSENSNEYQVSTENFNNFNLDNNALI